MEEGFEIEFINLDILEESTNDKISRQQNESAKIIKDNKVYLKFLDRQFNRIESIKDLTSLPTKNQQIRIITQKSFNAFALLRYILNYEKIIECYLTSYNIDKNTIRGLREIVNNGDIDKLTLLISESINYRMPQRAAELKEIARNNISLIFAWNHTKILLCRTKESYYVIEGSGNLASNARIEQYLFEESKEMFEFHRSWIEEVSSFCGNEVVKIN